MRARGSHWLVRAALGAVVLTAASAPEVRPAPAFGGGIHERITRNAFPFMTGGVLDTIVAGNLDEDEGDEADLAERHAQNCRFRDSAAYVNMRYRQVVDALREPQAERSQPRRPPVRPHPARRAGLLFALELDPHAAAGAGHPRPSARFGPGLVDAAPRPIRSCSTTSSSSRAIRPRGSAYGCPPTPMAGSRPRCRSSRIGGSSAWPTGRRFRGLMTSAAPRHPGDQLCPPVGGNCDIASPENVCLRHGDKRSADTSSRNFDGAGRMNLDGGGGRRLVRRQAPRPAADPARMVSAPASLPRPGPDLRGLRAPAGNWVGTDSGTNTPTFPAPLASAARPGATWSRSRQRREPTHRSRAVRGVPQRLHQLRSRATSREGPRRPCGSAATRTSASSRRWFRHAPGVPPSSCRCREPRRSGLCETTAARSVTYTIKVTPNSC